MNHFLDRLRQGLATCGIQRDAALVAVSGGADSVALLRGMAHLRQEMGFPLRAAHLNHNLRAAESAEDVRWLETLCERYRVPLTVGSKDVAAIAVSEGRGIEETARQVRYAFLRETAVAHGCSHVAVAHTADDQAETVLHHVIRGTGIAGLRGIPQMRRMNATVVLVRPLLEISRQEVEGWLDELGQEVRCDPTNRDESYTRNRLRHALLPLLRQEYNPQVGNALRRLARQAADVQEMCDILAARLLEQAVEDKSEHLCRLNCLPLADQPRHLIRECFALLWRDLDWPRQRMGFHEWDRLTEIALHGGAAALPAHIEGRRRGNLLVLRRLTDGS